MIKSVIRLGKKAEPSALGEGSTSIVLSNDDDFICLGHDFVGWLWNHIGRYKIIETVGNEIHEHLALKFDDFGGTVVDVEEMCILQTKIRDVSSVRLVRYTKPIIETLIYLIGAPLKNTKYVAVQHDVFKIVADHLEYGWVDNSSLANWVIQVVENAGKDIFTTVPSTINHIVSLYSDIPNLFMQIVTNPDCLEQIISSITFENVQHRVGASYRLVSGQSHGFKGEHYVTEANARGLELVGISDISVNPHLCEEHAKKHGTFSNKSIRCVFFELIDLFSCCRYSDFSVAFDLLPNNKNPITIHYAYQDNLPSLDVITPCDEHHPLWTYLNIDFKTAVDLLFYSTVYMEPCLDFSKYKEIEVYKITVCKTYSETLILLLEFRADGKTWKNVKILDMVASVAYYPGVILVPSN